MGGPPEEEKKLEADGAVWVEGPGWVGGKEEGGRGPPTKEVGP